MKQKTLKLTYIIAHGVLVVFLSSIVLYLLIHRILPQPFETGTHDRLEPIAPFLLPTFLHIILSFIGMVPALYLPATSKNEIERVLMPPMYLSMTLTNIPVIVHAMAYREMGLIGMNPVARIYVFAILFTTILLLFMGLFHLGINTSKIFQFTLLAALGCILIAVMVPLSVAMNPMDQTMWITDRQFFLIPLLVGVIAGFNYLAIYLRERLQHSLFQSISIILIISGYLLNVSRMSGPMVWLGIIFFGIGIVIGIPRGRFSQIQ